MANPALKERQRIQQIWPGATVVERHRCSIKHAHPTEPNRFFIYSDITPMHYGAGEDQEIDTAWQVGDAVYQWKMDRADYKAEAKSLFNGAPLVRYTDQATGEWVTFQARQLEFNNDRNDVQLVGAPQPVMAAGVDNLMAWSGAFGPGLDFQWQTQIISLIKRLIIRSFADLPTPITQIATGGNPVLRLQWQFAHSSGVDIWINGSQWDGHSDIDSSQFIEFRNSIGQVLWKFEPAKVFEATGAVQVVTTRISKAGPNLFVEVRVPYPWLQTAVYPVRVDPVIDTQVSGAANDTRRDGATNFSTTSNYDSFIGGSTDTNYRTSSRFTGITGLSGATINTSYVSLQDTNRSDVVNTLVHADDSASPTAPTTYTEFDGKTLTTNVVHWDGALEGYTFHNSPSLNAIIQELADSYDPTAIQIFHKRDTDNTGTNAWGVLSTSEEGGGYAEKLYIDYTAGGTPANLVVADLSHTHSLDAVSVTTGSQVVVEDASHTNALDAVALTQIHILAVADLSHTNMLPNIVIAADNTLVIDSPVQNDIFQRSGTTGNILISGTFIGGATAIEASWNGGAYVTIDADPTDGVFSGTLSSQPQGQGTLTVRFTNDHAAVDTVAFVGISDNFVIAGQSNAVGYTPGNQSYSHASLKAGMFANDYNWKELTDPVDANTNQVDTVSRDDTLGGSCWPPLATLFMADQGLPIGFIPCALGGTSLYQWLPGADHQDRTTLYGSMIYRALRTGCKAVLFWLGESDIVAGTNPTTFNADLDTLADAVMADLGVPLIPMAIQDMSTTYGGYDETAIDNAIRLAWRDNANIKRGPDLHLITFAGGLHYDSPEAVTPVAAYWWEALQAVFYHVQGDTCWGHHTGVTEDNARNFINTWMGTGLIENTGDTERISLASGQYMESEVVYTGAVQVNLSQNVYSAGDTAVLKYRHGASEAACLAASWNTYSSEFISDGYVQVRVENS